MVTPPRVTLRMLNPTVGMVSSPWNLPVVRTPTSDDLPAFCKPTSDSSISRRNRRLLACSFVCLVLRVGRVVLVWVVSRGVGAACFGRLGCARECERGRDREGDAGWVASGARPASAARCGRARGRRRRRCFTPNKKCLCPSRQPRAAGGPPHVPCVCSRGTASVREARAKTKKADEGPNQSIIPTSAASPASSGPWRTWLLLDGRRQTADGAARRARAIRKGAEVPVSSTHARETKRDSRLPLLGNGCHKEEGAMNSRWRTGGC